MFTNVCSKTLFVTTFRMWCLPTIALLKQSTVCQSEHWQYVCWWQTGACRGVVTVPGIPGNGRSNEWNYKKLKCRNYRIYLLISRTFLPGIRPVFFLLLVCATYPEGQRFLSAIAFTEQKMTFSGQMFATTPMTQMEKMKMTPATIYRTYRRTSFFRWERFLRFLTIKLTFITFACKNQYLVADWSCRVFTGEKVN